VHASIAIDPLGDAETKIGAGGTSAAIASSSLMPLTFLRSVAILRNASLHREIDDEGVGTALCLLGGPNSAEKFGD